MPTVEPRNYTSTSTIGPTKGAPASVSPQAPEPVTDMTNPVLSNKTQQVQEQPQAVETATQETNQEDLKATKRLEFLARKEKQLRHMMREIEEKQNAFKQREEEYLKNYIPKNRIIENPYNTLEELGVPYDKVTQEALAKAQGFDPLLEEIKALKNELSALKNGQEESKKQYAEATTRQYQEAVKQIKNEVISLVTNNDAYEAISSMNAHDAVVKLIEKTYQETGTIMNVEDAAKDVEDYLTEEAIKVAQLKKIQNRLMPKPSEPSNQAPQPSTTPKAAAPLKTLTNAVNANAKPMSAKDRRERAIAAFKGQL